MDAPKTMQSRLIDDFIAQQIPLGQEFSKVLYENLWDLYEEELPC